MMRARLQIVGLVFAVLMPLGAQAEGGNSEPVPTGGGFHIGFHGPDLGLYEGIPLTAAQQAQKQEIMGYYQQQARPLALQLISAEGQLRELMLAPGSLDVTNALALEQQVTQLNAKLDDLALDALALVRSHLTKAQLADAQAAYEQRMAAWRQASSSTARK
jgi:Spy/CpxP family protein refolding chaperone